MINVKEQKPQLSHILQKPPEVYRILIGTPCGGGQLCVQYMLSMFQCIGESQRIKEKVFVRNQLRQGASAGHLQPNQMQLLVQLEGENLIQYEIGIYTLSQESLLSRGRNHIASVAIRQGWDKLFFIDADSQWSWEQFKAIINSPHDFVAGAVPLKVLNQDGIHLNFLPFEDDAHYFKDRIRSVDSLLKMKDGHGSNFVPVAFVGTAFMCLSRKVLLSMASKSEEYQYPNPATGFTQTCWNIFNTKPMNGKYMSEDWAACHLARELGYKVYVNADVIISHVGTITYSPQMAKITYQPKLSEGTDDPTPNKTSA